MLASIERESARVTNDVTEIILLFFVVGSNNNIQYNNNNRLYVHMISDDFVVF